MYFPSFSHNLSEIMFFAPTKERINLSFYSFWLCSFCDWKLIRSHMNCLTSEERVILPERSHYRQNIIKKAPFYCQNGWKWKRTLFGKTTLNIFVHTEKIKKHFFIALNWNFTTHFFLNNIFCTTNHDMFFGQNSFT